MGQLRYTDSFHRPVGERSTAVEWGITSVQACNPTGGVGTDQCTPFMQAAADYNMGSWETMQGKYGYLLSHTATTPVAGPSAPTLSSSSSTGGTISAAYVFVEVSAWDQSYFGVGGNYDQMKDTLPSSALVIGPLSGSTNQVTVITNPTCADYRVYGYHTWIATNTTNTVPAQSAFYFADPTAEGEGCGANVTFTSVPSGGTNPPTIDSTDSGLPTWCSGCTDVTVHQDTATTMNAQAGSGFIYYTDENFATTAEFDWQQMQTDLNYAPGVLLWSNEGGSADCTAAGRQRFIADVVGCDPYGESALSDKTDLYYMYGNNTKRSCFGLHRGIQRQRDSCSMRRASECRDVARLHGTQDLRQPSVGSVLLGRAFIHHIFRALPRIVAICVGHDGSGEIARSWRGHDFVGMD